MVNVLALESEEAPTTSLEELLQTGASRVYFVSDVQVAIERLSEGDIDLAIFDTDRIQLSAEELVNQVKEVAPFAHVVLTTKAPSVPQAVEAIRAGAIDYLAEPFDEDALRQAIAKVEAIQKERRRRNDEGLSNGDLREFQHHLDSIFQNMLCGVAILQGPEFRYLAINQFLADLNGLPIEDHLGRPLMEVLPEAATHLLPVMRRVVATGEPVNGREFSISLPKNPEQPIHLLDHLYPTTGPDGKPDGVIAIVIDITDIKRSGEQRARLEAAVKAKSDLLSRVSHEFRTPMNAILGHAQLLQMDGNELSEPHRESVGSIMSSGNHLLALINSMLDLSQSEARELKLDIAPVSLNDVFSGCLPIIEGIAMERGVTIPGVPETTTFVLADAQRLRQVVLNLLSNAVKYNRKGGAVSVRVKETPDDFVRIEIKDTGLGIPETNLDRIFEPFHRSANALNPVEGTGLGLTISKSLIEQMDGQLGVESTLGKGSTFWIQLPKAEPADTTN
ncbi:MAG: PAS domain-containing protein [Armatimonadetes bacterium]|nr:PAS domain-containing protein [Armatimonadota bacterium]